MKTLHQIKCVRCLNVVATSEADFATALQSGKIHIGRTASGNVMHSEKCQPYDSDRAKRHAPENKTALAAWGLKIVSATTAKKDQSVCVGPEDSNGIRRLRRIEPKVSKPATRKPAESKPSPAKPAPTPTTVPDGMDPRVHTWCANKGATAQDLVMIQACRTGAMDASVAVALLSTGDVHDALDGAWSPPVPAPKEATPTVGQVHELTPDLLQALLTVAVQTGQPVDLTVGFKVNGKTFTHVVEIDAAKVRTLLHA